MQYLSFYASDLHEIWNRDSMNIEEHIPIMIKAISTSQEPPASSKPPVLSSIFESVLDAFKLNRFKPNLKHSFLRSHEDHPKHHQGYQPQSGMSMITTMSNNSINVIDLWKDSWYHQTQQISNIFNHNFLRAYEDNTKCHQRHQHWSGMDLLIINSINVTDLWKYSLCLQTQNISTKF